MTDPIILERRIKAPDFGIADWTEVTCEAVALDINGRFNLPKSAGDRDRLIAYKHFMLGEFARVTGLQESAIDAMFRFGAALTKAIGDCAA